MISSKVNGLERRVVFKPGYHRIHKDPKKNFGVHCMEVWMYVIGKKGAVHFGFMTGMYLPKTFKYWESKGLNKQPQTLFGSMGIDVGYHSLTPMFEGQKLRWPTKMGEKKKIKRPAFDATSEERAKWFDNIKFTKIGKKPPKCYLLGVPCYCDGSAIRAEDYRNIMVQKGDDAIWKMLEGEYKATFKSKV